MVWYGFGIGTVLHTYIPTPSLETNLLLLYSALLYRCRMPGENKIILCNIEYHRYGDVM